MMNKFVRKGSIVLAILVLFGSVAIFQVISKKKEPPKRAHGAQNTFRKIEVRNVKNEILPINLDIQGELVAFEKIDIFAEVSGTLKSNSVDFKVGNYFKKGSPLLSIDDEEAKLQLFSQRSTLMNTLTQLMPDLKLDHPENYGQWKSYLDEFDMYSFVKDFPEPANKQEKYYLASKNIYTQFFNIKSAESRLKKYTIYAPFSGVITESNINPGTLVRSGQKLGELMNTSSFELEASVSVDDLKHIRKGNAVKLYADDGEKQWTGFVKRISNHIDRNTQTALVFIAVSGSGLREGMFLRASVEAGNIKEAIQLDRDLLVDQRSVYIVEDSVLQLKNVEVVSIRNNEAVVRGISNGTMLPVESISGAYEGMKILPVIIEEKNL